MPHTATTPADLLPRDQLLTMSGLEFMQAYLDGKVAGAPIARTLNFTLQSVESGRVVFEGTPQFKAANPFGAVHGGWYGAILDTCMGCAVMTKVPRGKGYTTLEYSVNIMRAIPLERPVTAIGISMHSGRSTGTARGEIRDAEGRLCASASTTCIILDPRP